MKQMTKLFRMKKIYILIALILSLLAIPIATGNFSLWNLITGAASAEETSSTTNVRVVCCLALAALAVGYYAIVRIKERKKK